MDPYMEKLKEVRVGILFALLTLLFGFGLGAAFGAAEDSIKGHLKAKAQNVFETVYKNDKAKMKKIVDKSWVYFKRAHLHANGLGTTALVLILLLSSFPVAINIKKITAVALGFGSLGYSAFWMFAGLKAPALGSTGAAKESLELLAIPSSGLCMLGLIAVLVLTIKTLFLRNEAKES